MITILSSLFNYAPIKRVRVPLESSDFNYNKVVINGYCHDRLRKNQLTNGQISKNYIILASLRGVKVFNISLKRDRQTKILDSGFKKDVKRLVNGLNIFHKW